MRRVWWIVVGLGTITLLALGGFGAAQALIGNGAATAVEAEDTGAPADAVTIMTTEDASSKVAWRLVTYGFNGETCLDAVARPEGESSDLGSVGGCGLNPGADSVINEAAAAGGALSVPTPSQETPPHAYLI